MQSRIHCPVKASLLHCLAFFVSLQAAAPRTFLPFPASLFLLSRQLYALLTEMVRISRQRLTNRRRVVRRANNANVAAIAHNPTVYGAAVLMGVALLFAGGFAWISGREVVVQQQQALLRQSSPQQRRPLKHILENVRNADQYDALADDVWSFLGCQTLLNQTSYNYQPDDDLPEDLQQRRRLEEFEAEENLQQNLDPNKNNMNNNNNNNGIDDDFLWRGTDDQWGNNKVTPTAAHLFCLAGSRDSHVAASNVPQWTSQIHCPATTTARQALLELWNAARSNFLDDQLLQSVLKMTTEHLYSLVNRDLYLWDTLTDQGLDYMVRTLNNASKTVDDGGIFGLEHNLGPGKVFVDVGSGLGTTSLAMAMLYPGTRIISIEVAAPNWLLQELNWRCNRDIVGAVPDVLLFAGVGPDARQPSAGKFLWKPSLTTVTRAWNPASERLPEDVELTVHLEAWHALQARAEFTHVDVLNIDCGACEYNFIPALTDDEFNAISTVMGNLHWGYIPYSKLPSSERGRTTHERICQHENFAKTAKECCDVPYLQVISSYPGQVLVQHDDHGGALPKQGTVADVAGDFCDDFAEWAVTKRLHDVPNDFGWFQLSSVADGY